MVENSVYLKTSICKELNNAIKFAVSNFTTDGVVSERAKNFEYYGKMYLVQLCSHCDGMALSPNYIITPYKFIQFSQATQSLCNLIEAIFIHGLNDAFFLKGSRYSKYPEPNFWPFVSKFTHRNIKTQIANLKQIQNEVGKARAWIRIAMSENALENYISYLLMDKNQLNVFYQKNAFLCDREMVEAFNGYLKALSKLNISVPANSSFLNNWTPTPLIMAGLCFGKVTKINRLASIKQSNTPSVLSETEDENIEIGTNALEFLNESPSSSTFSTGLPGTKNFDIDNDDEKSSVYSHPSLLDGAINTIPRLSFTSALSCTPENVSSFNNFFPTEEHSSEVIVCRKKTRIRCISRSNLGFNMFENSFDKSRKCSTKAININSLNLQVEDINLPLAQLPTEVETLNFCNSNLVESPKIETVTKLKLPSSFSYSFKKETNEQECFSISPAAIDCVSDEELSSFNTALHEVLKKHDISVDFCNKKNSQSSSKITTTNEETSISRKSLEEATTSELSFVLNNIDINKIEDYNNKRQLPIELNDGNLTCYDFDESNHLSFNVESVNNCRVIDQECQVLKKQPELEFILYEADRLSIDDEVVVVDNSILNEIDEYGVSNELIQLTKIPVEKSLEAQDYCCLSCQKSINGSFNTFRLCNLDCRYYCEDCWARGDESIIPARVIWNWDCRRRPICKSSKVFLKSIKSVPFIRIDKLNMRLYEHSKSLNKILNLRTKLSLAVMYLLTCKQSIADDIRKRMSPHEYLHYDIHLYSILDLEQVINGLLEKRLNSLISFAIGHVNNCTLCFQKGFVCELCSSKRVIYPFQTEIVYRCKICFTVYHIDCIASGECLKCFRRAQFSTTRSL